MIFNKTRLLSTSDIRRINKKVRAEDDSSLWPINGRFSVADRAIRRIRWLRAQGLVIDDAYSYEAVLESEMSSIVNDSSNW